MSGPSWGHGPVEALPLLGGLPVGLPDTRWDLGAPLPSLDELGRVHVLATGGAGMSGVALLLLQAGVRVSGCDGRDSEVLQALRHRGATISVGHDPRHLDDVDTVVVSSAIRETNAELAAARDRGRRVLHRSQALATVASPAGCRIAVAGANGKTTTAAMLAVAISFLGWDPSFALGGDPVQLRRNAGLGLGDEFVIEADESDGSFVCYRPRVAVVTSVQPDHLDFFGTPAAVEAAYRAFVLTIEPGGLLVACADDPGAAALADWAEGRGVSVRRYGTGARCDVRLVDLDVRGMEPSATALVGGAAYPLRLRVPGRHNLLNAAGALAALSFGTPWDDATESAERTQAWVQLLGRFEGVRRRFERIGTEREIRVVDDYAHNPAKVAAVVATGRAVAGEGRLVVVFQPHLYSRTRDFAAEFGAALADADLIVLTDIYGAREDPLPGVTSELVVDAIRASRPTAEVLLVPALDDLPDLLAELAQPGDLVITVGAGDITTVGPQLVARLEKARP